MRPTRSNSAPIGTFTSHHAGLSSFQQYYNGAAEFGKGLLDSSLPHNDVELRQREACWLHADEQFPISLRLLMELFYA